MADADPLAKRLQSLKQRVGLACVRAGRDPASVRLLPITKGFPAEMVARAMGLGLNEFGENRIQEAEPKIAAVTPRPRWHLVGHLQSNKAKRAVQLFDVIHSLDSPAIAREVAKRAAQEGREPTCLVEVNTSGDATKYGAAPEDALALLRLVRELAPIRLAGLMTIGPLSGGPEGARASFRALAALRRRAADEGVLAPDAELSMGMSDDFEIAIEEGSTMVRIGTALFGARPERAPV
jgi:pyridoxal phosphate enzyme (YggS family)